MRIAFSQRKSFARGFWLALVVCCVLIAVTFSVIFLVPDATDRIGSLSYSDYKPWIYLMPAALACVMTLVVVPGLRNLKAMLGMFVGGIFALFISGVAIYILIAASLPNMRY